MPEHPKRVARSVSCHQIKSMIKYEFLLFIKESIRSPTKNGRHERKSMIIKIKIISNCLIIDYSTHLKNNQRELLVVQLKHQNKSPKSLSIQASPQLVARNEDLIKLNLSIKALKIKVIEHFIQYF